MSAAAGRELPLPAPFGRSGGRLAVEGRPLDELADRFGTPLYVSAERRIRENARAVRSAFRSLWEPYRLLYAVKANPNPAIVRLLASEGCGADCSSPAEIRIARESGLAMRDCLYTGAYPSQADLDFAIASQIPVNLDDPALLPRLLRTGRPHALSFRVNPGRTASGPEGLKFAGRSAKFGVPLSTAIGGLDDGRRAGVESLGLHTMPGSNVLDPAHFARVGLFLGESLRTVRRRIGLDLDFLDAGGGFGVPYRPNERPLDLPKVAALLTEGLRRSTDRRSSAARPTLMSEPGRYLLADSTVLLTRVTHVKSGSPRRIGVDAGMHTLLRPALYGAYHAVYPVVERTGSPRPFAIVGPVCENTDVLAVDRRLPEPKVGDLLAIGNAGAYGFSMASHYNTRPRPAELLVTTGTAQLIRAAEGFEDLVRHVRIPPHLARASAGGDE